MQASESSPATWWGAVTRLVIVNVLWGLSFPLTKTFNMGVDEHFAALASADSASLRLAAASWLIFFRFTTAFLLFGILFRSILRRAGWAEWSAGFQIGTFFYAGLILQIIALATIPASRSGFLTSLVAVFTPLLTALLLRKRPSPAVLLGVALAMAGVSVLTGLIVMEGGRIGLASQATSAWTLGDSLTTIGAIFFAGQIMLVDYHGKRLDAAGMTPGMFASTALFGLITFGVVQFTAPVSSLEPWLEITTQPRFWSLILILSLMSSVLAFHWMNTYQHYVTASQAGIIYTLEPVFASAAAMVLPGLLSTILAIQYENEQLAWSMAAGGALIIAANLVSLWPARPEQASK